MLCPKCKQELKNTGTIIATMGKQFDPNAKHSLYRCTNKKCSNYEKTVRYDEALKKFV